MLDTKTAKYYVAPNQCRCHPETCCCNDYAVYMPNGDKWDTYFYKEHAEDEAKRLNDEHSA